MEQGTEALQETNRSQGLMLAGWEIGRDMLRELEAAQTVPANAKLTHIEAAAIGGRPLWLRAEPAHDPAQADALANILRDGIAAQ